MSRLTEIDTAELFDRPCAHCGEPADDRPVHVVGSEELGTAVWFHGTGVCNIVANGGSVDGALIRAKIKPGAYGAQVDAAVRRMRAPDAAGFREWLERCGVEGCAGGEPISRVSVAKLLAAFDAEFSAE